jgi:hypothetical protein
MMAGSRHKGARPSKLAANRKQPTLRLLQAAQGPPEPDA